MAQTQGVGPTVSQQSLDGIPSAVLGPPTSCDSCRRSSSSRDEHCRDADYYIQLLKVVLKLISVEPRATEYIPFSLTLTGL